MHNRFEGLTVENDGEPSTKETEEKTEVLEKRLPVLPQVGLGQLG